MRANIQGISGNLSQGIEKENALHEILNSVALQAVLFTRSACFVMHLISCLIKTNYNANFSVPNFNTKIYMQNL